MLLYIHVPFCRRKCAYCSFFSLPLEGKDSAGHKEISGYLATLLRELSLWGERLGAVPVESIFFGGGTPSLLPAEAIAGILERVRGTFTLSPTAEITIEANPESALGPGWMHAVRKTGVNRLSLGVQSLDNQALGVLGRAHTAREAAYACELARSAGFTNLSLDLMWGLPGQTVAQSQVQWLRQLKEAVALEPNHISAYGLTLEDDSPLMAACDREELVLPAEHEQASMYLAGGEYLESQGFMQYEISNFARMGFECRHNLGYWEGVPYLGLGPAATSTLGTRRWTNAANLAVWQDAVRAEKVGEDYEELDLETRLREMVMLRLRTAKGLSFKEWRALSGRSFTKDHGSLLTALQQNGLAASRKGAFRLTRAGMLVSNTIIGHFFDRKLI